MATTTFNDLITFSRGSNATLTGPNGLIQWAPSNLLTNSESFEASAWVPNAATITANSTTAPSGTTTADTLTATAGTGTIPRVADTSVATTVASYTVSIYAKAGTYSFVQIYLNNQATEWVNFTLSDSGTATANGSCTASITAVGSGWYRLSMTYSSGGVDRRPFFMLAASASATRAQTWNPTGTETIFLWGAQLELGSTATTYNNTSVKNLLGFSEAFDNAGWTKTRASIVPNAAANPVNGLFNAQKLMEDTATGTHLTAQVFTATSATVPYTFSVYAKAAGRTILWLGHANFTLVSFNLSTGVADAGGVIQNVGNGWYRCSVTANAPDTVSRAYNILLGAPGTNYTGDGNSGIYIYGAQLSNSASLDPYVPTPGAAPSSTAYYGPRFDYDPVTLQPKGLLIEEQRVNLLTYSEQFNDASWAKVRSTITANSTVAPDGTTSADTLVEDTSASATHQMNRVFTGTAVTHTFSVYVKAAGRTQVRLVLFDGTTFPNQTYFDLANGTVLSGTGGTITPAGGGWYRCAIAATLTTSTNCQAQLQLASGGTNTYTGDGTSGIYLWGAQLEAGAFATSYIPTVASAVTRSADVATITGSLFSQWYRQDEGAFVAEVNYLSGGSTNWVLTAHSGAAASTNDYTSMVKNSSNINRQTIVAAGVSQGTIDFAGATANTIYKLAGVYKLNDAAFTVNGATPGTDTTVTLPTPNALAIGNLFSQYLNGYIRSIHYIPARAADFQLQQLTS